MFVHTFPASGLYPGCNLYRGRTSPRRHVNETVPRAYHPRMSFGYEDSGYRIMLEIPGMKKDEITIHFSGNAMTVSGERRLEAGDRADWLHRERRHGAFNRSVRFRKKIDASRAAASYEDGILTIEIPLAEEARPKSIQIQ